MKTYIWILVLAGTGFLFLSLAWPQEKPVVMPKAKPLAKLETPTPAPVPMPVAQTEEDPLVEPLKRLNGHAWQPQAGSKNPTFRKLPQLRLRGLIKLKDKETVALLEIDGQEIYRVSKGDTISLTMRKEDVASPEEMQPQPVPTDPEAKAKEKTKKNGDNVGIRKTAKPSLGLKEVQVVLEIVEVNKNGLAVEARPLNERILVR